jgi:signal transduction histidine kinase
VLTSVDAAEIGVASGRILVVDDEPHMGTICAQTLRLDAHHVETTMSPEAAVRRLEEARFDLLLTDISMPGMNGLELANRARLIDPTLGVVMMTAYASYENMAAALQQGVADFLSKPFEMDQLRLTVTRALQRQRLLHDNLRLQTSVQLLEASQKFSASLDPSQIAAAIVEAIRTTIGISCVHVRIAEDDVLVDSGVVHEGPCLLAEQQAGGTANGRDRATPQVRRLQLQAADELVGEVLLATPPGAVPSPMLETIVQLLTNQAATALHNARLYAALAELDRQKSEFITIASHELRTPLSIVLGYSSMLRDRLDERHNEYINQVVAAGLRINDIVDDLVNLRHLDVGDALLKLSAVPLPQLIEAAVHELRPLAVARGIELEMRQPRAPLVIRADRDKLMMAVANLVANAIRFTPAGGQVTVASGRQDAAHGGNILIAVRDTGIGIPAHEFQRIFDRFYQIAESRTREHGGLGIGLSIARGFVQLHDGSIDVQSMPGRGSLFVVSLPPHCLVEQPPLPGESESEAAASSDAASYSRTENDS